MNIIQGTPVNISGRTGGSPGPATTTATRVPMPVPPGRQKTSGATGPQVIAPATTFARYLRISCVDGTNDLKVSFMDGITVTIVHGSAPQEFFGTIPWVVVQASAATVQWEAFAVVAA